MLDSAAAASDSLSRESNLARAILTARSFDSELEAGAEVRASAVAMRALVGFPPSPPGVLNVRAGRCLPRVGDKDDLEGGVAHRGQQLGGQVGLKRVQVPGQRLLPLLAAAMSGFWERVARPAPSSRGRLLT